MQTKEVQTKSDKNGDILVTVGNKSYKFHQPCGRDLIPMEKALKNECSETEAIAILLAQLQDGDKLTSDQWLDEVPLKEFKQVGKLVSELFLD